MVGAMPEPLDPFDSTIWDPFDSEQAIEDPFHGPSAKLAQAQTPAMPLGNRHGEYYRPGASPWYTLGSYFDPLGRPAENIYISTDGSLPVHREHREWINTYHQLGEPGLAALETSRQQKRLAETGLAFAFRPQDMCPGGKELQACEPGGRLLGVAREWIAKDHSPQPGEGTVWNIPPKASDRCTGCSLSCEAAIKTVDGVPQYPRVTFVKLPELPGVERVSIQIKPLRPVDLPEGIADFIVGCLDQG
jgi:hypothetical protein